MIQTDLPIYFLQVLVILKKIGSKHINKEEMSIFRLEDLPDELILKVFSSLGTRDLICLGQMSNRIRAISHDEQFWQKINLYHNIDSFQQRLKNNMMGQALLLKTSKSGAGNVTPAPLAPQIPAALKRIGKIPASFLNLAISNGCKYLSLYPYQIDGKLELNQVSSLVYLKLHQPKVGYFINYEIVKIIEELLTSCDSLQKLSMNSLALSLDMVKIVSNQNGKTLQVLDLNGCKIAESWEIKLEPIQIIVRNCINLKEVNFDNTILSKEAIRCLVENVTLSIQVLSLNYVTSVNDEYIRILVNRCKELKTLNLAHTPITIQSLLAIVENLKPSLEQLDITGTRRMNPTNIVVLVEMPKLQILIGSPPLPIKKQLKTNLPHLEIYDFGDNEIKHQKFLNEFISDSNNEGIWEIKAEPLKLFSS
jgi:hypothetical protein